MAGSQVRVALLTLHAAPAHLRPLDTRRNPLAELALTARRPRWHRGRPATVGLIGALQPSVGLRQVQNRYPGRGLAARQPAFDLRQDRHKRPIQRGC
jgi:hypothetical protein